MCRRHLQRSAVNPDFVARLVIACRQQRKQCPASALQRGQCVGLWRLREYVHDVPHVLGSKQAVTVDAQDPINPAVNRILKHSLHTLAPENALRTVQVDSQWLQCSVDDVSRRHSLISGMRAIRCNLDGRRSSDWCCLRLCSDSVQADRMAAAVACSPLPFAHLLKSNVLQQCLQPFHVVRAAVHVVLIRLPAHDIEQPLSVGCCQCFVNVRHCNPKFAARLQCPEPVPQCCRCILKR